MEKPIKCLTFKLLTAVLVLPLFLAACDGVSTSTDSFTYQLQGTWETNDSGDKLGIQGKLEISFNIITISGYDEYQIFYNIPNTPNQLPFRDFDKGVPLKGYSEDTKESSDVITGHIYIEDMGLLQPGIPFRYHSSYDSSIGERVELLRFNFDGRNETLRKVVENKNLNTEDKDTEL